MGIEAIGRCSCEAPAQQYAARASYRERTQTQAGSLSVRTEDGDVVNISFASLSQKSVGKYAAAGGGAGVRGSERSSTSAVAVEISIEGELDSDEVEDIRKLLSQLASAVRNPNPRKIERQFEQLDTLSAFQFGYEETVSKSYESISLLA
ncbi:MAG: hypothetical protein FJW30_16275 [Acidobacteria bacterium]|nr:hypothetical protein [Acidobacteriota bacterium]